MTKTRAWTGGTALVAVLVVLAAWFLLIAPQRSQAAELRDRTQAQLQQNDAIALKTKQLKAQFAALPARQAELALIKQQMPETPALPSLVRELSANAAASGVTLVSVAPGVPVAASTNAVAPDGTTRVAPAGSASALQAIPVTIQATGTFAELTLFLQKTQSKMRRAYLVQNITLSAQDAAGGANSGGATSGGPAAATSKGDLTLMVTGQIFVLKAAPAASSTVIPPTTTPGPAGPAK